MTEYTNSLKLTIEEADKLRATMNTSGWKILDNKFQQILSVNLQIIETEHKDIEKLIFAQAIIKVIKDLYREFDTVNRNANNALKEVNKLKGGLI